MWEIETPERATIPTASYNFAASRSVNNNHYTGKQVSTPGKSDLAATHVVPDAGIKHTLTKATETWVQSDDPSDAIDKVVNLVNNTIERNNIVSGQPDFKVVAKGIGKRSKLTAYAHVTNSNDRIITAYTNFEITLGSGDQYEINERLQELHTELSVAPGNLPDYGKHREFNQPVSDRYHLNVENSGRLSPISSRAIHSGIDDTGVAVTQHGNHIVTRQGGFFPVKKLDLTTAQELQQVGYSRTNIPSPKATTK